jgi:hypothetical protein
MDPDQAALTSRVCTRRAAFLAVFAVLSAACGSSASGPAVYGAKQRFSKNAALAFPDFDLTYQGQRHVASPVYKHGFDYQDFRVSRGGQSIIVSWSAGTGLLGPQEFTFGGRAFSLELRHTDKLGWLKDDEVVVEKK